MATTEVLSVFNATGLSPTIKIIEVETSITIVNGDSMIEVGSKAYKYTFTSYDPLKNYYIVTDDGTGNEQYAINNFSQDLHKVHFNKKKITRVGEFYEETVYDDPDGGSGIEIKKQKLSVSGSDQLRENI